MHFYFSQPPFLIQLNIALFLTIIFNASYANGKNDIDALIEQDSKLQLELKKELAGSNSIFCEDLHDNLKKNRFIKILQPDVKSDSYKNAAIQEYVKQCPSLDMNKWGGTSGYSNYHGTSNFKIYNLDNNYSGFPRGKYFIYYAESYFSPEKKERYKDKSNVYPWGGYAYATGHGGGVLYSVVDRKNCKFTMQKGADGTYNHKENKPTNNLSNLFEYKDSLYQYDLSVISLEKKYGSMRIWKFVSPNEVKQVCVFGASGSRAHLRNLRKNNKEKRIKQQSKTQVDCKSPSTTIEINHCLNNELKKEDAELNSEYGGLVNILKDMDSQFTQAAQMTSGPKLKALRKSQRAWIKYRDTNCDYYYNLYYPGTAAAGYSLSCKIRMTKSRTDELRKEASFWKDKGYGQ